MKGLLHELMPRRLLRNALLGFIVLVGMAMGVAGALADWLGL